jgi:hypothetical protein
MHERVAAFSELAAQVGNRIPIVCAARDISGKKIWRRRQPPLPWRRVRLLQRSRITPFLVLANLLEQRPQFC